MRPRGRPGAVPLALCLLSLCGCPDSNVHEAPPEPKAAEPQAPGEEAAEPPAPLERFGEMQVVRVELDGFDALPLRERKLLYYLQEAALSGRDVAYDQRSEHNLLVRRTLEAVLESYQGSRATHAFQGLVRYAKRFFFARGIHHPVSGAKLIPEELVAPELAALVQDTDPQKLPLTSGQSTAELIGRLTPIMFDPDVAPHPEPPARATHDIARGYPEVAERIVHWLDEAAQVARAGPERAAVEDLKRRYLTQPQGDAPSVVADAATTPLPSARVRGLHVHAGGREADLWGALTLTMRDDVSPIRARLAAHAPWFEQHAPMDPRWRRDEVPPLRAFAADAVVAAGQLVPARPVAAQLPTWPHVPDLPGVPTARLHNVTTAYISATRPSPLLSEFVLTPREERRAHRHMAQARQLLAALHDTLGHASGRMQSAPAQPSSLRELDEVIAEARADALALYFLFDEKLIELELMPHFEVARAGYDDYVRSALLVSLAALDDPARVEDVRLRAARLVMRWVLERDPAREPTVQRVLKGGETYFQVADYLHLRRRFGELFAELSRVRFEADHAEAQKLVERYADDSEKALVKQVRRRYARLDLPTAIGFQQPRLIAEREGGRIDDVRLHFAEDFLAQELEDSRRYGLTHGALAQQRAPR